jgi:hypothetical protein
MADAPYPDTVILAAVPQVDVVKDWFDYLSLSVGTLGTIAAAVAIGFSVRAQKDSTKARRAVSLERRRQFELEILRHVLDDVDEKRVLHEIEFSPSRLQRYEHRIELLPDDVLPYWRKAMKMNWYDELALDLDLKQRQKEASEVYQEAVQRWSNRPTAEDEPFRSNLDRLAIAVTQIAVEISNTVRGQLMDDLHTAIRQRVDAEDE